MGIKKVSVLVTGLMGSGIALSFVFAAMALVMIGGCAATSSILTPLPNDLNIQSADPKVGDIGKSIGIWTGTMPKIGAHDRIFGYVTLVIRKIHGDGRVEAVWSWRVEGQNQGFDDHVIGKVEGEKIILERKGQLMVLTPIGNNGMILEIVRASGLTYSSSLSRHIPK